MPYLLLIGLLLGLSLTAQDPFRDATAEAGITADGRMRGVAVCDPNGDGHPDLFLCRLDGSNLLYLNDGRAHFTEAAAGTALADTGPAYVSLWADFDRDGRQDVVIGHQDAPVRLYRNTAESFVEVTATSGLTLTARVQAGALLDYDGDGRADIFLSCLNAPSRLYRNLGNFTFREVGADAGAAVTGLGMGCLAFDYDGDGDSDLYLVRDGSQPNVLLRNDGGRFTDVSAASGAGVVGDGMGVDAADYDGDGDFDLYVTNLYENFLLENRGDGTFRETGFDARVNDLGMGWGTAWLDYDLDGQPDLYVANETGFAVAGQRYPDVLYHNQGGTFAVVAGTTVASRRSGYGAVTADFNADGRPDLFVANSGQPSQLLLNQLPTDHHWARVELVDEAGKAAPLGARVTVWTGGRALTAEVRAGGSFASQQATALHFGLGTSQHIDSLLIRQPGGDTLRRYALPADRAYRFPETATTPVATPAGAPADVRAYPNPAAGRIALTHPLREVRVYDVLGRCVARPVVEPVSYLDLPVGLAAGLYRIVGWSGRRRVALTVTYSPH
ncbi:FG-GAP-like repeat-containing protein [Lewinella sp. IMCC34183]|uniref:FG-GAP-like repeat-containing protein n=1 Tax=Lewinella sp. IMCC34183 TaxID=2248762 RepID=UPI000E23E048|nr:FG-GAP-like repeat-containing protein [Lewinella sp. IMCC34183]